MEDEWRDMNVADYDDYLPPLSDNTLVKLSLSGNTTLCLISVSFVTVHASVYRQWIRYFLFDQPGLGRWIRFLIFVPGDRSRRTGRDGTEQVFV